MLRVNVMTHALAEMAIARAQTKEQDFRSAPVSHMPPLTPSFPSSPSEANELVSPFAFLDYAPRLTFVQGIDGQTRTARVLKYHVSGTL